MSKLSPSSKSNMKTLWLTCLLFTVLDAPKIELISFQWRFGNRSKRISFVAVVYSHVKYRVIYWVMTMQANGVFKQPEFQIIEKGKASKKFTRYRSGFSFPMAVSLNLEYMMSPNFKSLGGT